MKYLLQILDVLQKVTKRNNLEKNKQKKKTHTHTKTNNLDICLLFVKFFK